MCRFREGGSEWALSCYGKGRYPELWEDVNRGEIR